MADVAAAAAGQEDYGVYALKPFGYERERHADDPEDPHMLLLFRDPGNPRTLKFKYNVAINVKSRRSPSELVYVLQDPFTHTATINRLKNLGLGFHDADTTTGINLDYLRTPGLVDIKRGAVLKHDVPGHDNDLLDKLEPVVQAAIRNQATVYIFGFRYSGGNGAHKVHMNQGSVGDFITHNSVGKDGAIVIHDEDGWKAVFLAFASQRIPTNSSTGDALPTAKKLGDQD